MYEFSERPEWNFTETGPKPDRNRNKEFLPNRNRTGTKNQYQNNSIKISRIFRAHNVLSINI